jgi:hypothetical protein
MIAFRRAALIAASLCIACATPALAASEWPVEHGDYVEVSSISVDDGHALEYAQFLAGTWRKSQDYAKQQGWITSYEILENPYARDGEADIYLITHFATFPTKAEEQKRDEAYRAYMQRTDTQMLTESGERAKYRHAKGSMLLRQLVWSK